MDNYDEPVLKENKCFKCMTDGHTYEMCPVEQVDMEFEQYRHHYDCDSDYALTGSTEPSRQ